MGRLITNKEKQKAASDPTEKPNKYMKSWATRKLRSNVGSEINSEISDYTKPGLGKDRRAKEKGQESAHYAKTSCVGIRKRQDTRNVVIFVEQFFKQQEPALAVVRIKFGLEN